MDRILAFLQHLTRTPCLSSETPCRMVLSWTVAEPYSRKYWATAHTNWHQPAAHTCRCLMALNLKAVAMLAHHRAFRAVETRTVDKDEVAAVVGVVVRECDLTRVQRVIRVEIDALRRKQAHTGHSLK